MPLIDAHLHLWDLSRLEYPWLDSVPAIRRTFLAEDYGRATAGCGVEKMVFVQCECLPNQYLEEVIFVHEQARQDPRIAGMVAYAPLEKGKGAGEEMAKLSAFPLVKGVRRMYDDAPELCTSPGFLEGLRLLPAFGFSFDISVKPHALPQTIRMIEQCPSTQFILDHLGKPSIRSGALSVYRQHMDVLTSFPNVVAKISGLLTEADPQHWTPAQLEPYVEYALDKFGFDRLLFGGDWPVVELSGTYPQWLSVLNGLLIGCSPEERTKLFYTNAKRVYRLEGTTS
jgi:L-fuconolactonase